MIVCPSCRAASEDGSERCAACGASLLPGPSQLRARRSPTERPVIEIQRPRPPSRWRPVIVIGGLVSALLAVGAYLLFRPDPCRDSGFVSTSFGYCVDVPEGWSASQARFGTVTLDQFSADDAAATIVVEAVDLPTGSTLEAWADGVRGKESDAGIAPGPAKSARIAGIEALTWDATSTSAAGTSYRSREFVVVVDDVGWRITLSESASAFPAAADSLDVLLATWRFA